jgi:hypothetical protein
MQQPKPWWEIVEEIRTQHNGIMSVTTFMGHDGHNVCRFHDYQSIPASGESGRSMQEAVERCVENWLLELEARHFANNPEKGMEQ